MKVKQATNKYAENRVRPCYSNYVKPKSTSIYQPEVYSTPKGEATDRFSSKGIDLQVSYGVKGAQNITKRQNYMTSSSKTGRENAKGITLYKLGMEGPGIPMNKMMRKA